MVKTHKKKTRAQRKSSIVAIISSVFTLGFVIASVLCGINLPKRYDYDQRYENNYLESLVKGPEDSYYLIATHRDSENVVDDGFLYHYNSNNELIEKCYLFDDIETEFGITDLVSIYGLVTSYEDDSIYVFAQDKLMQNYLFRYQGMVGDDLHLTSYADSFPGKLVDAACDEDGNIFTISVNSRQYRIDHFKTHNQLTTPYKMSSINSGYIYDISENDISEKYELTCSKSLKIFHFTVDENYLYIFTAKFVRRINKDLSGCNYRILFEQMYQEVVDEYPYDPPYSIEQLKEINEETTRRCKEKYGWIHYSWEDHNLELPFSALTPEKFAFYTYPDQMVGTVNYHGKLFLLGTLGEFFRYSIDELNEVELVVNHLEDLRYDRSIVLPYDLTTLRNVFGYDGVGKTAMVYYQERHEQMSVFDLQKETFIYTVDVAIGVEHAFYSESTDTIFYKYADAVNHLSGYSYLSSFQVNYELNRKVVKVLFIVFIILAALSLIVAGATWLSYLFKRVMNYLLSIFKGIKKHWVIYVVIFPSIFLLCLFCYYPGISAIITSFYDYKGTDGVKVWNNFANYAQIFGNSETLLHFGNMALFLIADIVLAIVPPLIFAYFLTLMRRKKLSGVIRTLLFIPGIIPGIAGLLIWRTGIYGEYGLVNSIIKASGGQPINFFQQSDYTNMLWLILMGFPFVGSYLIFYGAMMNIPSSYYEAAEIDGITVFKRFIKIDIPLCAPQIKYIVIMTIIGSIQNFSRVYVAMGGTPGVVSTPIVEMYSLMNSQEQNYGLASAYATILFVILFFLTYLSMRKKVKDNQ